MRYSVTGKNIPGYFIFKFQSERINQVVVRTSIAGFESKVGSKTTLPNSVYPGDDSQKKILGSKETL